MADVVLSSLKYMPEYQADTEAPGKEESMQSVIDKSYHSGIVPKSAYIVAIVTMLLGSLGILIACYNAFSNVMMLTGQVDLMASASTAEERRLIEKTSDIVLQMVPFGLFRDVWQIGLGLGFIIGGIGTILGQEKGRRVLMATTGWALGFVLFRAALGFYTAWMMGGVLQEVMVNGQATAEQGDFLFRVIAAGGLIGAAIQIMFFTAIYGTCLFVLTRPYVIAGFVRDDSLPTESLPNPTCTPC
jgi:hypothetical protein